MGFDWQQKVFWQTVTNSVTSRGWVLLAAICALCVACSQPDPAETAGPGPAVQVPSVATDDPPAELIHGVPVADFVLIGSEAIVDETVATTISAKIGRAAFVNPLSPKKTRFSGEDEIYLVIRATVSNVSPDRKIDFTGWDSYSVAVTDNVGNDYAIYRLGIGDRLAETDEISGLYPGDTKIVGILAEVPVTAESVETLFISLSGRPLGLSGAFHFQIPLASIADSRRPDPAVR